MLPPILPRSRQATWTLHVEGSGAVDVFVDGQRVLHQASSPTERRDHLAANFEVIAGPHRVLIKFAGSTPPQRISISPALADVHMAVRSNISSQELAYELAAERYASGEYRTAVQQIVAVSSASRSAALQFLLAQSLMQLSPAGSDAVAAWSNLLSLAPAALAADIGLAQIALRERQLAGGSEIVSTCSCRPARKCRRAGNSGGRRRPATLQTTIWPVAVRRRSGRVVWQFIPHAKGCKLPSGSTARMGDPRKPTLLDRSWMAARPSRPITRNRWRSREDTRRQRNRCSVCWRPRR